MPVFERLCLVRTLLAGKCPERFGRCRGPPRRWRRTRGGRGPRRRPGSHVVGLVLRPFPTAPAPAASRRPGRGRCVGVLLCFLGRPAEKGPPARRRGRGGGDGGDGVDRSRAGLGDGHVADVGRTSEGAGWKEGVRVAAGLRSGGPGEGCRRRARGRGSTYRCCCCGRDD